MRWHKINHISSPNRSYFRLREEATDNSNSLEFNSAFKFTVIVQISSQRGYQFRKRIKRAQVTVSSEDVVDRKGLRGFVHSNDQNNKITSHSPIRDLAAPRVWCDHVFWLRKWCVMYPRLWPVWIFGWISRIRVVKINEFIHKLAHSRTLKLSVAVHSCLTFWCD